MKRLTTTVICIAGVMATAIAQQSTQPTQPGTQPGISSQRSETTYSATGRDMAGQQVRASKVIGAEVKASGGDELGKIEDIILNSQNGRADFAVINHENKLIPVPFKLLSKSTTATTPSPTGMEKLTFTAQVEKDKLQSAPTISDRTRWSELQQGAFAQRVYSHYGVSAEGVGAPGLGTEREGSKGTSRDREPQTPGTSPRTTPN
jgi:sporulation protein YlmC with PRC-barrel domain